MVYQGACSLSQYYIKVRKADNLSSPTNPHKHEARKCKSRNRRKNGQSQSISARLSGGKHIKCSPPTHYHGSGRDPLWVYAEVDADRGSRGSDDTAPLVHDAPGPGNGVLHGNFGGDLKRFSFMALFFPTTKTCRVVITNHFVDPISSVKEFSP